MLRSLRFHAATQAARFGLRSLMRRLLTGEEAQALTDYAEADVIITTGGTYLVEHYNLGARIRTFRTARALKKPLVFYTQSMGPFTQPANARAMKACLQDAALVLLRDERSRGYVRSIGADGPHVHVVADSVFALSAPSTSNAPSLQPRVAISVRAWQHFATESSADGMARYTRAISRAVEVLVEQYGADVLFISTCQGVPAYNKDDSAVALGIVNQLSPSVQAHVTVDRAFHTPEAFMQAVAGCALMISTRMHGAILGLLAGVPVVPVAYEFKTEEVYMQMGLAEWAERMDEVTPERLEAQVHRCMRQPDAVREAMSGGVARQRAWANEAITHLQSVPSTAQP